MKAHDIAPVAWPAICASCLQRVSKFSKRTGTRNLRSLRVLASTPHDDIRWARLGLLRFLVPLLPLRGLLQETHRCAGHAAHVAPGVCTDNTQQPLSSFLRQIRLFEHALGAVDVRQVERGAAVTGIEDSSQAHTRLESLYHDAMHLIVNDVPYNAEVDWVNDFIVAVLLIPICIRRLPSMTGVVEEQAIIWLRVFYEPMHGTKNILLRRLTHRILLIVGQDDHILSRVAEIAVQVGGHVFDVIDASA